MITVERQVCFPNPCKHNGTCIEANANTHICNCEGTGYTGADCNVLLINTPEFSTLIVNSPMEFTVSSQPDRNFVLDLIPDDKNSIQIVPSSIIFSQESKNWNISMTAKQQGLFKLEYKVSDDDLNYQPIPPATILVVNNDNNTQNYFERHQVKAGLLQPGCCSADEMKLNLDFKCPSNNNDLSFKSTCGWITKGTLHSAGIIFSNNDDFNMPIAIAGANFPQHANIDQYIDLQPLNTYQFKYDCIGCNGGSVGNLFKSDQTCNHESISVNDIQTFLKYESLASTYLYRSMVLIPEWLRLKVLSSNRTTHDVHSYMVNLVHSNALQSLQQCNNLKAHTDGLHSVLVYTGPLEIKLNNKSKQLAPSDAPICFATNLCEGDSSPLYITASDKVQSVLGSFDFMDNLKRKEWIITINSVAISNSQINMKLDGIVPLSYWNGMTFSPLNQQKPNMVTNVNFSKEFLINNSANVELAFSGDAFWFYKHFNKVSLLAMCYHFHATVVT